MAKKREFEIRPGRPHPLGATPADGGVNFSVFSRHATGVELLLFDNPRDRRPRQVVRLDPLVNRTFCFWHCFVKGLKPGAQYAYRVDGPWAPHDGHRFNRNKVLLDPYAKGVTSELWNRVDACGPNDNLETAQRSVVIDLEDYDWEGDRPLNRPLRETIIYEAHLRGFTRSPTSGVKHPGTFSGFIEKIPYLQSLGVTAVELLPVFEFDDSEILRQTADGRQLKNFWGYSTVAFFAPENLFCVDPGTGQHVREFRDLVKALHRADIEVILDVVFNHTNEGNHEGPTISFKGLENSVYYHLVRDDKQYYMDYSGCGNTVNCNHPVVEKFIAECLEYWVREMHVDGFRFDEGSILSRGENGAPLERPPVLWRIELSETLADTKVIAEAWDAAGLYQVGYFPGYRWAEWNGRFRDDVRRFVSGQPGMAGAVASRLAGSADLYQAAGRRPVNSINFVTCHDGFTLNDLVSYNGKHNEANGEGNRDGINDNLSWNCGVEGETDDPAIESFRGRQARNFAAILLLGEGVPMILGGDEVRRTQRGNNNAYCQDNELSWFDWSLTEKNKDLLRFFSLMIAFRKRHHILQRRNFFGDRVNERGVPEIAWHGCRLNSPGWHDPGCRVLSYTMGGFGEEEDLHVILNLDDQELEFEIPAVAERRWLKAVDTGQPAPADIAEYGEEKPVKGKTLRAGPRSVIILVSR